MMSSHSRILANLSSKENMSPQRKRSSEEAFSSSSPPGKVVKRRTVDAFLLPKNKSKTLFSSKSSNKLNIKKQTSIKNYYREGLKQNSSNIKVFDENKKNAKQKPKQDDAFSLMCAEEAPEKYWELLAEERRKGLEIALKENKDLAEEIRQKDKTIAELKTEVSELQETAKHAEHLVVVLEELGKDCGVTEEDDESDSENEVFEDKDISISYDKDEELLPSAEKQTPGLEVPREGNGQQQEKCSHDMKDGVAQSRDEPSCSAAAVSSEQKEQCPHVSEMAVRSQQHVSPSHKVTRDSASGDVTSV